MYVLRAFPSSSIVHVYDRVDPVEDFEIVQSELILKDIESVQKKMVSVEKMARIGKEDAVLEKKVIGQGNGKVGRGYSGCRYGI